MGRWWIVLVVLVLIASTANALNIPVATRSDFAMHRWEKRRFDRHTGRPSEVGGNPGDMTGRTKSDCQVNFTYTFKSWSDQHSCHRCDPCRPCEPPRVTLRVESFHVNGSLNTVMFLPRDATKQLMEHENGHFRINAYAYDQAYFKSNRYARGMLGRQFSGNSLEDAQNQLNNCFNSEFRDPFFRWWIGMGETYDSLTRHGDPTGMNAQRAANRVMGH